MKSKQIIINVLKWTARISGLLVIALFVFMLSASLIGSIMEGDTFNPSDIQLADYLMMSSIPILFSVGVIIAWKRELIGGIIIIISVFLFNFFDFLLRRDCMEFNVFFWQIMIIGALFIIVSILKHRKKE
jgi:hypothetical protein